ncbi:hypothetical protein JMJ77_0004307, partial [Colletotrichum scovillei]
NAGSYHQVTERANKFASTTTRRRLTSPRKSATASAVSNRLLVNEQDGSFHIE